MRFNCLTVWAISDTFLGSSMKEVKFGQKQFIYSNDSTHDAKRMNWLYQLNQIQHRLDSQMKKRWTYVYIC